MAINGFIHAQQIASEMTNMVLMPIVCKLVMGRTRVACVFLLLVLIKFFVIAAQANNKDCKFCSNADY